MESDYDENKLYQIDNMSLDETKEKLEWRKRTVEYKQKNTYGIKNQNYMRRIHDNKVNKIAECNLLHDIINHPKRTKILIIHYSPIIHGCINIRKVKVKFKNFLILMDSGFSSTIIMGRLVEKLNPDKDAVMQWHTQAVNITTNIKVNTYFILTSLSVTNFVTWKCHVDDSTKDRYDMILGRYILT